MVIQELAYARLRELRFEVGGLMRSLKGRPSASKVSAVARLLDGRVTALVELAEELRRSPGARKRRRGSRR